MSVREEVQVIEIVGEGRTDIGREGDRPEVPTGIVPVLVHRLCDKPDSMRVRRKPFPFLEKKKSLWQKVWLAKRQASCNGSAGIVFVVNTEGEHPDKLEELQRGRDFGLPDYPAAVGAAHPCIEAWLLADAPAISRAMRLPRRADVPAEPESLPAPRKDRNQNPKAVLGRCAGRNQTLSAAETTRIVQEIRDLSAIRDRCPIGFAPFADEVIGIIKPVFKVSENGSADS